MVSVGSIFVGDLLSLPKAFAFRFVGSRTVDVRVDRKGRSSAAYPQPDPPRELRRELVPNRQVGPGAAVDQNHRPTVAAVVARSQGDRTDIHAGIAHRETLSHHNAATPPFEGAAHNARLMIYAGMHAARPAADRRHGILEAAPRDCSAPGTVNGQTCADNSGATPLPDPDGVALTSSRGATASGVRTLAQAAVLPSGRYLRMRLWASVQAPTSHGIRTRDKKSGAFPCDQTFPTRLVAPGSHGTANSAASVLA